jgi:RNase P/RNase MRP subunit POP5
VPDAEFVKFVLETSPDEVKDVVNAILATLRYKAVKLHIVRCRRRRAAAAWRAAAAARSMTWRPVTVETMR